MTSVLRKGTHDGSTVLIADLCELLLEGTRGPYVQCDDAIARSLQNVTPLLPSVLQ
jgi:hypothetical protein